MKVINFFGAPGAGKSTAALGLAYKMKLTGYNVELVSEFAKDLVYEDNIKALSEQNYVFANQEYRLAKLKNIVDYVITDSPILLSNVYVKNYPENFKHFCFDMFNRYDNVNFMILRNHRYVKVGRLQDELESIYIEEEIMKMLKEYNTNTSFYLAGNDVPEQIFNELKQREIIS